MASQGDAQKMKSWSGPLLMGIDVGTFASKGVLCTMDAHVVAHHEVEHNLDVPRAGWAEQDADAVWWHDVSVLCRRLIELAGATARDIAALAVSAHGADLVPLDAQGRALRPGILYGVDTRATNEISELNERFGRDAIAKISGHFLSTQSIGPKMLWLRHNEPEIWRKTRYLCSASTFLVYRLTGQYVFDYPTAAWFDPLLNLASLSWDESMVEQVIGDKELPELHWVKEVVGEVTPEASRATGLAIGTPVTTGTLDAVADAVSVGVNAPGDLMVMYGTTTFLLHVRDTLPPPDGVLWHTPFVSPGQYALEGGTATTGAVTRWFRDQFAKAELSQQAAGGTEAYSVLTREAEMAPPGSGGLVLLPYFSGERTPLHDPDARGLIIGLNLTHGRGHFYRAILEATAFAVAHNLEALRASGAELKRAIAVGGGTKSPLLLQIVSDVTGLEQDVGAQTVGAAYGDAFVAGVATGILRDSALREQWVRFNRHYVPNVALQERYRELYGIYRDLYLQTRSAMHALSRFDATYGNAGLDS
ncbi:MAG TPA: FGGY-family carbohydrate kinase [Spirochaetia bacterium]|nr:FGGY-family carbohydrate kinase [Spirochaetia bacterium]